MHYDALNGFCACLTKLAYAYGQGATPAAAVDVPDTLTVANTSFQSS